jgi:hypothetical protein
MEFLMSNSYFNAKTSDAGNVYYEGEFTSPKGVVYRGVFFDNGTWFKSSAFKAKDHDVLRQDEKFATTFADTKRPAVLGSESTDVPLVARANPYATGKFVASLFTADEVMTLFVNKVVGKFGAQLEVSAVAFVPKAELEARRAAKAENGEAKPDGAQARAGAGKRAKRRAAPEPQAPAADSGGNG